MQQLGECAVGETSYFAQIHVMTDHFYGSQILLMSFFEFIHNYHYEPDLHQNYTVICHLEIYDNCYFWSNLWQILLRGVLHIRISMQDYI